MGDIDIVIIAALVALILGFLLTYIILLVSRKHTVNENIMSKDVNLHTVSSEIEGTVDGTIHDVR